VEQALVLDDGLAEAHASLALLSDYVWDSVTSEREYRRALELDPSSVEAQWLWAWFVALQGRVEEAIAEVRIALETNPLSPRLHRALADFLYSAGHHREAMEQVQHALELDPSDKWLHWRKGQILAAQERYDEALAVLEGIRIDEDPLSFGILGRVYARAGKVEQARAVLAELDELSGDAYVPPVSFAFVHAGLGDNDRAFEWLDKALAERDAELTFLKFDPAWDPIREDARFAELISRISYFIEN
jgi:tetratricopeptide (TPR) repeat protein